MTVSLVVDLEEIGERIVNAHPGDEMLIPCGADIPGWTPVDAERAIVAWLRAQAAKPVLSWPAAMALAAAADAIERGEHLNEQAPDPNRSTDSRS